MARLIFILTREALGSFVCWVLEVGKIGQESNDQFSGENKMKTRLFFWMLPLLVVLPNYRVLRAQENSYIIIHALNPEGVEIASIEGMGPGCVAIFDGDTCIGYGIHNEDQCNRPITVPVV